MAVKITGISRDLIIHPGETIADVLEVRGMTQAELAARTGVTAAYVSKVIAGKKDISAKFALSLEYALDIPKSFWLNLQANYDAELLEFNKELTITEQERNVRNDLKEIEKYLRKIGKLPIQEKIEDAILSLRKILGVSNLTNLGEIVNAGAFRMAQKQSVNPYVLGAWIRLCQITGENRKLEMKYDDSKVDELIIEIKDIMLNPNENIQIALRDVMKKYGIDFSIMKNFKGAPVQGYLSQKNDGSYQMVLTIRGAYADIFWFSLFHELGHLVNGDVGRNSKFLDDGNDKEKEEKADLFASDRLINPADYSVFINEKDFTIESIKKFSISQRVMPYVVIGRLQKEKHLRYDQYSDYKLRYKWAE